MTFHSKIDTWLRVVLLGSAFGCFIVAAYLLTERAAGLEFFAALIVLLGSVLPIWLMFSTRYTLTPSDLVIRSGPFRWRVPFHEIRSVTPTRSPLSSPALSLDRLRIDYGRRRRIMISPGDKESFLRELQARRAAATT